MVLHLLWPEGNCMLHICFQPKFSLALLKYINNRSPFAAIIIHMNCFQGLVLSKNTVQMESSNNSTLTQDTTTMSTSIEQKSTCLIKAEEEACPICQEKLSTQKMVFQCGHVTCCKCKFYIIQFPLLIS